MIYYVYSKETKQKTKKDVLNMENKGVYILDHETIENLVSYVTEGENYVYIDILDNGKFKRLLQGIDY